MYNECNNVIFQVAMTVTLSLPVVWSCTMFHDCPSSLYAILKADTNCTIPKSFAPWVMMPVILLGFSKSSYKRKKHRKLVCLDSCYLCLYVILQLSCLVNLANSHLEPLGAVVGSCRPSISLALLVQTSIIRVPGKCVNTPGAVGTGCWKLHVRDETRLHAQRITATECAGVHCHVEVNEK